MNDLLKFLLIPMGILTLGVFSFQFTHAYFSSSATSTNNVFSAASVFPVRAGDVVINEINWAGSEGHGTDEWVELRNMTNQDIDLSNWVVLQLGDSQHPDITIPSGKSISANGLFLISHFDQNSSSSKLDVAPDVTNSSVELLNNGERLTLKTNTGLVVDTADNDGDHWLAGSNSTPKSSMERNSTPGDGTLAGNWHTATTRINLDAGSELATPRATND